MIRINLLPVKEIKAEVGRRQDLTAAGVLIGLTLVLALGVFLFQRYRISGLENEIASIKKEIEALNVQVKEVGELEKKVAELQEKYRAIDELRKRKTGPVRVMEGLSAAVPEKLWLTQFRESGGSLTITGLAVDNQTVADFMKGLSQSPYFRNVDLVESVQVDEKTGESRKKFSLKSDLVYRLPTPQPEKTPAPSGANKEGKRG